MCDVCGEVSGRTVLRAQKRSLNSSHNHTRPDGPMTFLVPNADEKARISRVAEAKAIQKKKRDKLLAEKRKVARDEAKARSAKISAALLESAPPPGPPEDSLPPLPPLPPCEKAIEDFLALRVWYGNSSYENRERVKALTGAGTTRWCTTHKSFGTTAIAKLKPLLLSALWIPHAIHKVHFRALLAELDAREAHAVATQQRKSQELLAKREKQREKLLEADKADERKRLAAEEAEAKREAAAAAAAAAEQRRADAKSRANREAVKSTGVPLTRAVGVLPTAEEVVACTALGFSSEAIERTARLTWLGLCSGLSLEARLLRMAAIVEFHARDAGGHYFLPELYLPAQTASVHAFVARVLAETR